MSRTDAQPVHAYIDGELVAEAVDNNTGLVGSAISQHLPQAQVSGIVRGQAPHPYAVPIRTGRVRRARLVLAALVRSTDRSVAWRQCWLVGFRVREVRKRSIGFRWRRPQPVKGAVDRGSSDAEQLGEFGLGLGENTVRGARLALA